MNPDRAVIDRRVLLLAPTVRDGQATRQLLHDARLHCDVCPTLDHLCLELERGGATVILPEEVVLSGEAERLADALRGQAVWSDLPVVVLTRAGEEGPAVLRAIATLGNVSLVERPMRVSTLLSVVRAALRARERQYQLRDHLEERRRAAEERAALLDAERAARAEAERATRLKDEFLATLSHELRTPLNAIVGWAALLSRGDPDPEDVREGVETIQRNARAQTRIIEDLLDMSRIMSGKVRLELARVDLAELVAQAVETARPAAQAKGVRVSVEAGSAEAGEVAEDARPASLVVNADPNRLQQVMWNLLSNAVKFTPEGGHVRVRVGRAGGQAEVSVIDTGQGMDAEFLPRVFERFRQADGSASRQQGGLGLGLSIVRNLVEMHGGTVAVASPGPGQGATFTVRLPVPAVAPATEGRPDADSPCDATHARAAKGPNDWDLPDLSGLRVLVVDDEADARDLVRRLLEDCGAAVHTAAGAEEALALLDRLEAAPTPGEKAALPHVLVSDIGMPEVDGYALARRLRSRRGPAAKIPAAALTAFARDEDRQRATTAGYQAHVAKPVEPADLLKVVAELGAVRRQASEV